MPGRSFVRASSVALALFVASALPARAGDDAATYETLLTAKAPAVVSIKFVLKANMGGQTQESNQEVRGTVIDPSGLILVGNDELDGQMAMMKAMMKARHMDVEMSATPTDVKVLFGNEAKELPAVLVARDSTLGLAYMQILDLEGRTPEAVDLGKGAAPKIGQSVFGVTRKSRGFDCAPTIDRLVVNGHVEKPRPLWSVSGAFKGAGIPVFDADGRAVGVYSNQKGSEGVDDDGAGGAGALLAALGGASEGSCLLPLEAVMKSVEAARKRIPDAVARAKDAAAKEAAAKEAAAKEKDGAPPEAPKAPETPKAPDAPKDQPK